ncbi:MAG: hypothetical protein JYX80_11475 [Candidatus Scalindua sediminis]|nr:hypothetical protein [Candidatus Scalindua sediminis]
MIHSKYFEERVGVRVFQYYLGNFKMNKNNVARELKCPICLHELYARVWELPGGLQEGLYMLACEFPQCAFYGGSISLVMRMERLGVREATKVVKFFVAGADDKTVKKFIGEIIGSRTRSLNGIIRQG